MKPTIFFFLFTITSLVLPAQSSADCDKLAITFLGINKTDKTDQLVIEVSNFLYTGTLYSYPGFVLLNEVGDTIAKEDTNFYGIGSNFQIHLLDLKAEISFPFSGTLELFGSFYKNHFCSFPIAIDEADEVSIDAFRNEKIKVATNFSGNQIILDLAGSTVNSEQIDFNFNLTDENGEVVYISKLTDTNITSIPVDRIGGAGYYIISVWDNVNKMLLPAIDILIE